ncbi:dehydrogenase/reductase SDR family member 11-like [Saccoglossus kowalevskii]|uniref:Dehydrogenase/reductase SDR family member 11-like n=1 Tax=Saccoglossus kowalevskii TaxID=10224 RepID=A0ABM0LYW5_SACKO|nr:PREDICTED: dehydrogenase/reductase SDR family member 11-like [Saccoglossus kowalevskii]
MVSGLTEALRQELRVLNSHIRVTVISPGNTQSNFFSTLYNDELAEQAFSEIKCLQPSDIAAVVLDVLKSPPNVQINEITVRPVEQVS